MKVSMLKNTVLFIFLLGLLSCTPSKTEQELLVEAKSYLNEGKNSSAEITLKNIIKQNANLGEARYLLGKIYFQQSSFLNAEKELVKAIKSQYQLPDAFILLAQTKLALNKFDDVLELLEEQNFQGNNAVIANVLMAQAYLALGKVEQATTKIKQAQTIDPQHNYTLLGFALLDAYNQNIAQALKTIDTILAKNTMPEALLLKGSLLNKQKKYFAAAQAFEQYLAIKPQSYGIESLLAHNLIRSGKYEQAQQHVNNLLNKEINNPTVNILAAQLKFLQGDYQAAEALSNKTLQVTNNNLAKMINGLSHYSLKNYEQAYEQLNAIADKLPANHQVHKVLAILQLKLGYTEALQQTLANIDNLTDNDAEFFANIGVELSKQGNKQYARTLFDKAIELDPTNVKIRLQRGIYKIYSADESAIDDFEQAHQLAPNITETNIALAMKYLQEGKIEKAQKIAQQWQKNAPDNVFLHILNGNIALKTKQYDLAITHFSNAIKLEPDNIIALFNLAVTYSEQNHYQKSQELLHKLVQQNTEYPLAYRLMITNAQHLKSELALEKALNKLITKKPTAIWPRVILARRLLVQNKPNSAVDLLEEIKTLKPLPASYFIALAEAYYNNKQTEQALNTYDLWAKLQPNLLQPHLLKIDLLDKTKQFKLALQATEYALAQPKLTGNIQLRLLEIYYLLANGQVVKAKQQLNSLLPLYPDHPFVLQLQGQLALAEQDYNQAISYLTKSLEKNESTLVKLYLVTAYKAANKIHSAVTLLEKSLKEKSENLVLTKSLAELYITTAPDKAINLYEAIIQKNPNDYIALNNLAWVLYSKNRFDEALVYSNKANRLKPDHPQLLDTLALILTKQNQLKKALTIQEKAYKLAPNDKSIVLHLLALYKQTKQTEKAKRLEKEIKLTPTVASKTIGD